MLKGEGGTEPEHISAAAGGEDFGLIRFDGGEQDDRVMNKLKRRGKKKGEAERVRPVQREKRLEGAITRDKQETKQDVARLEDSLRSPFLFSCDDDDEMMEWERGKAKKGESLNANLPDSQSESLGHLTLFANQKANLHRKYFTG